MQKPFMPANRNEGFFIDKTGTFSIYPVTRSQQKDRIEP